VAANPNQDKDMRSIGIKKIGYFGLLGACIAIGAASARVPAPPPKLPGVISYYSDQWQSLEVGREIVDCNGTSYFVFGYATAYSSRDAFYCPTPIQW
jgi:hypothetical protein